MARTGVLGGGSLSPFGGATTDFGAFDVAKTVDAQESANLAFAIEREKHDAGLMTDAQFAAIQAAYLGGLDQTTISGATAQYTIQMTQYTNDRNALAQAVQSGQADPQQLADYDRNALGQVVPGSSEYMQRQDRLWTSEGMVFQEGEQLVLDNLQDGRITNQQAQDWYKQQGDLFGSNPTVMSDIKNKVAQFADRIVAEADKAMADGWNKGTLTIAQVISYTAQAAQADPGGSRAKELSQFAYDARLQAQESSMKYRYDLTREYADLQKLIASSAPSTGGTSTSTSTRTFWNGSKWVTQTSSSTSANKPSASMIAANKQRLEDIANAKIRMAQITKTIGNIAGGWVSDQDYIRNLTAQQSSMAKGSPGWYALQEQIDGHQQRIMQDKILSQDGIKVAYPRVASETKVDLAVGGREVPMGTGMTSAQVKQVQGWNAAISKLQESVATGTLTQEQLAQANADIAKYTSYVSNAVRIAKAPVAPVAAPKAAASAGSSSGGTVASRGTAPSTTALGTSKTNSGTFGPLQVITKQSVSVVPVEGTLGRTGAGGFIESRFVKTTPGGLPVGMSPSAFDDFHAAFIAAIKNGDPSFVDKVTGTAYAIPLDPTERLTMLRYIDGQNVALKQAGLDAAIANPKASQNYIDGKRASVATAMRNETSNILWVLNTSDAGTTKDANGKAIRLGTSDTKTKRDNSLAFGVDLLNVTMSHAESHFATAEKYFKKGDFTAAAAEMSMGQKEIERVSIGPDGKTGNGSLLSVYADQASFKIEEAKSVGAKIDGSIETDMKTLLGFSESLAGVASKHNSTSTLLFGAKNELGTGILAAANGVILPDPWTGQVQLNPGWTRYVEPDGTVTAKKAKTSGFQTYGDEKDRVMVMVNVGGASIPMSAAFVVNKVGEMIVNGQAVSVLGKIVGIGDETWMENPFQPGVWIPMLSGSTKFTAPTGMTTGINPPGKDNIPGLDNGAQFFLFNRGGKEYILSPNELGGYDLYSKGPDGAVPIGNGGTTNGTVDQNYRDIVRGFGYDESGLTSDQRSIINLVTYGINKTGGAWVGSSAGDIADFFLRPGYRDAPGVEWAGDTLSEKRGMDTAPPYQPYQPPYAPPTAVVTTAAGGQRVVTTGQTAVNAGMYEGAGGTVGVYAARTIAPPPTTAIAVSPTGVKKVVSTGQVAAPTGSPQQYEGRSGTIGITAPKVITPVPLPKPKTPIPSGEKAALIPKSGPVAK